MVMDMSRDIKITGNDKERLDAWMQDCHQNPYEGMSDEDRARSPFPFRYHDTVYGVNRFKLSFPFLQRMLAMNNSIVLMELLQNVEFGISPDMKQIILGSRLHDMIVVHPDFLYRYTPDEQAFAILHQLTHFLYGHEYRSRGLKYPLLWNALCDWIAGNAVKSLFAKKEQSGIQGIRGNWFRLEAAADLMGQMAVNDKSTPYLMDLIGKIRSDYADVSANILYDELRGREDAEAVIRKIEAEYRKSALACDLQVSADAMFEPPLISFNNLSQQQVIQRYLSQMAGFQGSPEELGNQIKDKLVQDGLDDESAAILSQEIMESVGLTGSNDEDTGESPNAPSQAPAMDSGEKDEVSNKSKGKDGRSFTETKEKDEIPDGQPQESQTHESQGKDSFLNKAKDLLSSLLPQKSEENGAGKDIAIRSVPEGGNGGEAQGDSKGNTGSAVQGGEREEDDEGDGDGDGFANLMNTLLTPDKDGHVPNVIFAGNGMTIDVGFDGSISINGAGGTGEAEDANHKSAMLSRLQGKTGRNFIPQNDPSKLDSGSASDEIAKLMNLPDINEDVKKTRDNDQSESLFRGLGGQLAGDGVEADAMFAYLEQDDGVVDWQAALSRYMREAHSRRHAGLDYTRPNRRQAALKRIHQKVSAHRGSILIPANKKLPQINTVWVALDVSGSMGDEELQAGLDEIYSILKNLNPRRVVINSFNAGLVEDIVLNNLEDMKDLNIQRGGGTEIEPLYARIKEMGKNKDKDYPEFLIVLTDMFLSTPPSPEHVDVYWVNLSEHSSSMGTKLPANAGILIDTKRPDEVKRLTNKLKKKP